MYRKRTSLSDEVSRTENKLEQLCAFTWKSLCELNFELAIPFEKKLPSVIVFFVNFALKKLSLGFSFLKLNLMNFFLRF